MDYIRENVDGGVKLSFTVNAKEWDGFIDRAFRKNQDKINVPGFRKGKAPRHLVERMYGKGVFIDDAFNFCFRDAYSNALDKEPDIYPVDEPKVEITAIDDNGASFYAVVTVKPQVNLPQYRGINIQKIEYNVSDADIDAELKKARERLSRKVEQNREVISGDEVNLDYSGSVGGVKFDGGTATDQTLVIGSNTFIPGFESQMIGMKKGETKDLTVTFPEKYQEKSLAGKEAVFTVTVNNIYFTEYPEINDELAKETSRFDTLAEYKEDIKKNLTESNAMRAKADNEEALIKQIVESTQLTIPDCMVQSELDYIVQDFSARLSYMYGGMKLEDYFKYTNSDIKAFRADKVGEAERNVKTRLVLEKIIAEENITVSKEDLESEIAERAESAKKTVDEYKKTINVEQTAYLNNAVLSKKLMNFLVDNNNFTDIKTDNPAKAEKTEKAEKPAKAPAKKPVAKKPAVDKE